MVPFSSKKLVVHQELQGYFECIDAIRREAERRIENARDAYSKYRECYRDGNPRSTDPGKCNEAQSAEET